jgi:hypothetical protein
VLPIGAFEPVETSVRISAEGIKIRNLVGHNIGVLLFGQGDSPVGFCAPAQRIQGKRQPGFPL